MLLCGLMAFYMEFVVQVLVWRVRVFHYSTGMVYGFCLLTRSVIGRCDGIEITGIYVNSQIESVASL